MNPFDYPWQKAQEAKPRSAGRYLVVFGDLFNQPDEIGTAKFTREEGWSAPQDFSGRLKTVRIKYWGPLPEIPQ